MNFINLMVCLLVPCAFAADPLVLEIEGEIRRPEIHHLSQAKSTDQYIESLLADHFFELEKELLNINWDLLNE